MFEGMVYILRVGCPWRDQCLGGGHGKSGKPERGTGSTRRCEHRSIGGASKVAWHHHRGRQGLRQRRIPQAVATVGKRCLHSTALQPAQGCELASGLLPKTAQGGKLIPAVETLPQSRDALRKKRPILSGVRPIGCDPGLAQKLILKTRLNEFTFAAALGAEI